MDLPRQQPAGYYDQGEQPYPSTGRQQHDRSYTTGSFPAVQPHTPRPRDPHPATGPQPIDRRHATGPQPMDARHTTGPQPMDRRYTTGPQPMDRRYATGPQPTDRSHSTGPHDLGRTHTTGQQPVDRRYMTGPQPADPLYSTGAHRLGGPPSGPAGRPQSTGSQRPVDRARATGPQVFDRRYATGPQPSVQHEYDDQQYLAYLDREHGRHGDADDRQGYGRDWQHGAQALQPAFPRRYDPHQHDQNPYGPQPHMPQPYDPHPHSPQPAGEQGYGEQAWQQEFGPAWDAEGYDGQPAYDSRPGLERENPARTRLREKKARRRHRTKIVGRASAVVLAVAVLGATGFTWGAKRWAGAEFRQVAALDQASPAIVDAAKQRGDDNFLLIGLDSRPGADAEDPTGGARSDTAMVVHIPKDRSRVVVLSFPGDLTADRPACEAWDQNAGRYTGMTEAAPTKDRISTAYRYGGPRCATKAVQQISGLAINHFVGMEFGGFKAMVDAVGGVQLCVDRPIHDDVLGDVVAAPGQAQLDGDRALAFVRAAHVAGEDGGAGRVRRQQELLAALARGATSTLKNPGRLDRLVHAAAASTFVDNVDAGQLTGLANALGGLDAGKVTLVTVPTTPAGDHRELRPEDATALSRAIIDGTPLIPENAAKPGAAAPSGELVPSVPPAQIKLQVVNGTGQDGLATQVARRLRGGGFEVVTMDNAPQPADRTVIRYAPAREQQAVSVAAALPRAALQPDASMGGAITVLLGGDFDGAVEAVQLGQPVPPREAVPAQPGQPVAAARFDAFSAASTTCG